MYFEFTCMPGERRLRSLLLYLCHVFRVLSNSLVCSMNNYAIEVAGFLLPSWAQKGHSHVGLCFANEEQKKVGSGHVSCFCHTCQTCLFYDWFRLALLNTEWQQSLPCVWICNGQDEKLSAKLLCIFVNLFLSTGLWCFFGLVPL